VSLDSIGASQLEHVAGGFGFLEGPVWHENGALLFTDVPRDTIHRWSPERGVEVWLHPANIPNGMTRDPQGRLLSCEQSTSELVRFEPDGTRVVVASHFQGKELNSPNDVVCRSDGTIYFTDPPAGRLEPHGRTRPNPPELDFSGVFLIRPGATDVELVLDDMVLPNGLCLSPDESVLYINDTLLMQVVAVDVAPDGTTGNRRVFLQEPGERPDPHAMAAEMHEKGTLSIHLPDGMKADERGNVYVGGPGGLWVVSADGEHLGTLPMPAFVGNLAWGDPDWRSLYICASHDLFRLRLDVAGAPPAFPR
jgi:gluconolactonase